VNLRLNPHDLRLLNDMEAAMVFRVFGRIPLGTTV